MYLASQQGARQMAMIFDFFRDRTREGIKQVENLAKMAGEGKLDEALRDTASYIDDRRALDSENVAKLTQGLSKSRERLLAELGLAFVTGNDLQETLKTLEGAL
jgi:hypothetical protein